MASIRFAPRACCAAVVFACAVPSALAQPAFSQFWSFTGSRGIGLGDDGRAVLRQPFAGPTYRWSYDGGLTEIENTVGNPYTTSPDGLTIIGGSSNLQYARGPVTNVTAVGPINFRARGASSNGAIIAGTSGNADGGFIYTPGSGFVRVQLPGVLPGGGTALANTATAMSRSGNHVAGWCITPTGSVLYRLDRTTNAVTTFPAAILPGPDQNEVRAMSDDGQVLYIATSDAAHPAPYRWTETTGYQALPTLTLTPAQQLLYPNSSGIHFVDETTADGSTAVGFIGNGPAFIWDAAGGTRDLATELTTRYLLTLPVGMRFTGYTFISADGLWLMGGCDLPTPSGGITTSTWIAYIPSPGSAALLGLGGLAALRRRRQH